MLFIEILANAYAPITFNTGLFEKRTLANSVLCLNASDWITKTPLGIEIFFNEVLPNALCLITSNFESGRNSTDSSCLHPSKARGQICLINDGITAFLMTWRAKIKLSYSSIHGSDLPRM